MNTKRKDYICYTAGYADKNHVGGSAYSVFLDGVLLHQAVHSQPHASKNRMELLAAISAVNWCRENNTKALCNCVVNVCSSSYYTVDVARNLRAYRQRKNACNKDMIELLARVSEGVLVFFHWQKFCCEQLEACMVLANNASFSWYNTNKL